MWLLAIAAFGADPTVAELLDASDDFARGASSHAVLDMYVKTANYERSIQIETWSQGTEKSLMVIRDPAKDAGVATLKLDENIWNYLPKVDRTLKIPAGMMSGSWMGSHFTNDDLVKESRLSADYTATLTGTPATAADHLYTIELVPKPDAPVVWGKLIVKITADKLPVSMEFFGEDGKLARTESFTEIREMDGRRIPSVMTLVPADKPAELTRVTYVSLDFDVAISSNLFSLQSLHP